jgi:predicted CopG family antitoxin
MIATFTLARRGNDWELISAGEYASAKDAYNEIAQGKDSHDFDEVVMTRIRRRRRFGDRIAAFATKSTDTDVETDIEPTPAKKRGRPRKTNQSED